MANIENRKGKWRVKIRRKGFPLTTKTFDTKQEALDWSKVHESEMIRGVFIPKEEKETTTLCKALDRYSEEITPLKKGKSQESYRIKFWKEQDLAQRTLSSLQGSDFAKWRDNRLKEVEPATVLKELAIISHLYSVCQKDWGMDLVNPIKDIRKPKVSNSRERRFEDKEEGKLFEELNKSRSKVIKPLIELALETAMRQGELITTLWKFVDIKKSTLHIPDTKNGTSRNVPLSINAKKVLSDLLPKDKEIKEIENVRVFDISKKGVHACFTASCKKAGILDFTFHDLRHEATSRLAEKLQMHELMKMTGHKTTSQLARYYHPKTEDLARKLG